MANFSELIVSSFLPPEVIDFIQLGPIPVGERDDVCSEIHEID